MQETPKPGREYGELPQPERKLLGDAMYEVMYQILSGSDEVPDVILPDTSGRIAEQLFIPMLETAAHLRQVTIPQGYRFVSVSSQDATYMNAYRVEQFNGIPIVDMLRRQTTPQRLFDAPLLGTINSLEYAQRQREVQQQQAHAIQLQRQVEGRTIPLIILDTMVDQTITWKEINRAFQTDEQHPFPLFVLFTLNSYYVLRNRFIHTGSHDEEFLNKISYLFTDRETILIRGARKVTSTWGANPYIEEVKPNEGQKIFLARLQQEITSVQTDVMQRLVDAGILPSFLPGDNTPVS